MKSVLFTFGPFHLYSFGLMVGLGVFLSLFLMHRRAVRDGFPSSDQIFDLVLVTVLSGFAGARIFFVVQNYSFYLSNPLSVFAIWEGGLVFYGGVIGSLLGLFLFMQSKGIPYIKGLDFLLPYVALTHTFGRIGCFLNGCCYGKPCSLPWAVKFPETEVPVHPTQIYEAIFTSSLFLFLNWKYPRRKFEGEVTALYFMIYAVGRFLIEFFRGDNPQWLSLTTSQWLGFVVFSTAVVFYFRRKKLARV